MITTKNSVADAIVAAIATQYGDAPGTAIAWVIEDTRSTCGCGKFFWNGCVDCDVTRMSDDTFEALAPLKRLVHARATDDELRAWHAGLGTA